MMIRTTDPVFLDGHIGEMDKHIVQFLTRTVVAKRAETTETALVKIRFQGTEWRNQNVPDKCTVNC